MKLFFKITGLLMILAFLSVTDIMAETERKSDNFTLNFWKAYRFSDEAILEYNDNSADIAFCENPDVKKVPVLIAKRIKAFGKIKPDTAKLTESDIDLWDSYVNAPITGYYYAIKGKEKGKYYLLYLKEFQNKKESIHFWKITFQWELITVK